MDPNALAIPIAFILLAALLCLLLIGSKWNWKQKLAVIVIVPTFGLVVWDAIDSYSGWPTFSKPPERSLLHDAIIVEPDESVGEKGAIFLWLMPFDEGTVQSVNPMGYVPPKGKPRGYELPYSRPGHEQLVGALGKIRENGRPMILDFRAGQQGSERQPQLGGSPGMESELERSDFQIYDLPPPNGPIKYPD